MKRIRNGGLLILFMALLFTFGWTTVKAESGDAAQKEGDGLFTGVSFESQPAIGGFSVGHPRGDAAGGTWTPGTLVLGPDLTMMTENWQSAEFTIDGEFIGDMDFYVNELDRFYEAVEDAEWWYNQNVITGCEDVETYYLDIDGHPMRLNTYHYDDDTYGRVNGGCIFYVRNNYLLRVFVYMNYGRLPVRMEDMIEYADSISYDDSLIPLRQSQVDVTVEAENGRHDLISGKSLRLIATFGDEEVVNARAKNNSVSWYLLDGNTWELSEDAKISAKGVLTANQKLTEPVDLWVEAVSDTYSTYGTWYVRLLPAVTKLIPSQEEITFYTGTEDSTVISLSVEPASTEAVGVTWKSSAPKVATVEENDDGTVTIYPVAVGKTNITAKEEGGKQATVKVTVKEPVAGLEISASGKVVPGGTVTMKAKVAPANATDKTVFWSLDVGEDIASVNKSGQVKISKNAPEGTVITVTCTADGAPEPVTETWMLEVAAK